jgi:hypothetical protein
MKYIKYLFVMVFAVMLSVSCNSDDDSSSVVNDPALVGTWETTGAEEGFEIEVDVTFKANNTGTTTVSTTFEGETFSESDNFTWSTNGNKLTIVSGGETDVITYSISGNELTTTDESGDVVVFTKQ